VESNEIADRVAAGDVRSAARLMRWLDDGDPRAMPVYSRLFARMGKARRTGITGSAGVGKSTLVDALVAGWRSSGQRVGVVAVDPSSPFTGGALLGDRVRLGRHAEDPGVFIRSLASRGRLGGLSASTALVADVLDAMGFDQVVIETVGVGQGEVEILRHVDATVVVVAPGHGDEVQAQKAGLLEIADVLVVNKADLDGAEDAAAHLEAAIALTDQDVRRPRVLRVSAREEQGVGELLAEIQRLHGEARARPGDPGAQRTRTEALLADLVAREAGNRMRRMLEQDGEARAVVDAVLEHRIDPFAATATLLERLLK
jgi:LAO/AO transport system kinase